MKRNVSRTLVGIALAAMLAVTFGSRPRREPPYPGPVAWALINIGHSVNHWGLPGASRVLLAAGHRAEERRFQRCLANGSIVGIRFDAVDPAQRESRMSSTVEQITSAGFTCYRTAEVPTNPPSFGFVVYVEARGKGFAEALEVPSQAAATLESAGGSIRP